MCHHLRNVSIYKSANSLFGSNLSFLTRSFVKCSRKTCLPLLWIQMLISFSRILTYRPCLTPMLKVLVMN